MKIPFDNSHQFFTARHAPSKMPTFFKNKPTDDIDGGILATGYWMILIIRNYLTEPMKMGGVKKRASSTR